MSLFSCRSVNLGGWLVLEPVSQTKDFNKSCGLIFIFLFLPSSCQFILID